MKKIKENYAIILIGLISIILNLVLHDLGIFSLIETKLYDARFKLRGPLLNFDSDVVLVEIDDESFRLIPEPYPYPRGSIWSRVVKNLTNAGAKVIAFDIQFDAEDRTLKAIENSQSSGCENCSYIDQDQNFQNAIKYALDKGTKIILASKIGFEPTRIPHDYLVLPTTKIMKANPQVGLVDHEVDIVDNVSRRYSIFSMISDQPSEKYLSLGVQAVLSFLDFDQGLLIDQNVTNNYIKINGLHINAFRKEASFLMNFYGPASSTYNTFPRYSLSQVIDNFDYQLISDQEDSDWMDMYVDHNHPLYNIFGEENSPFKNKIVMIGSSLKEDHDFHETPFFSYENNENLLPGLEFHANAIQQLIHNNFIVVPTHTLSLTLESFIYHFLIISLFVIIILFISQRLSILYSIFFTSLSLVLWFSFSMGAFINDPLWLLKLFINSITGSTYSIATSEISDTMYLLPVCFPLATIMITFGLNLSYNLFNEQKNKNFLKDTFGRYISPELIENMYRNKKMPELGGESNIGTAFFLDIESFSVIAEKLTPSELVEFLNDFLSEQTEILINNHGTLDKYEGDAILGFFGAPVQNDDHAQYALDTGVEMNKSLKKLKENWKNEKRYMLDQILHMKIRIGINTGEMVTGNMGSKLHMNYTMIGEEVNLASRLESGSKLYGIYFHTTYKTLEYAGLDRYEWRYIDKVIFKGFTEWKQTVEIFGYKEKTNENTTKLIELFHKGLDYYYNREWDMAIQTFKNSLKYETFNHSINLNPSTIFLSRSEKYKENKPSKNWKGIYKLSEK